eukprot:234312-Chlamydomonas_euryale.AAC.1
MLVGCAGMCVPRTACMAVSRLCNACHFAWTQTLRWWGMSTWRDVARFTRLVNQIRIRSWKCGSV